MDLSSLFFTNEVHTELCLSKTASMLNVSPDEIRRTLISMIPDDVVMKQYSEKSFVVRLPSGNDDIMIKLGGTYNKYLRDGPGYIFPLWTATKVRRYIMTGKLKGPAQKKYKKKQIWTFDTITSKIPFVSRLNNGILGSKYKNLILKPDDQKDMDMYTKIINAFNDDQKYFPSEALSIIKDVLSEGNVEMKERREVFFRRPYGVIYWIYGDKEFVDKNITSLMKEYPPVPYTSYYFVRDRGDGKADAYLYHSMSAD